MPAAFTSSSMADRFPAGTSVGAYPQSNWMQSQLPPSGSPQGSPDETATMGTDGTVYFANLDYATRYFASAEVDGSDRYVQFSTGAAPAQSTSELERNTGLLLPLYIYPADVFTNVTYNGVIELAKRFHAVPMTVVLNPGSGPGTVVDGNYTAAIKRLRGAGVSVLGYVHTSYTVRERDDVKADVDTWLELYPMIDGIFIDEMTNDDDAAHRAYFTQLTAYVHARGLFPSVANPGAGVGIAYFTQECADVIVVYESSGPADAATLKGDFDGGYTDVTYRRRAALAYDADLVDGESPSFVTEEEYQTMMRYVGMLHTTSDVAPNPWDVLDLAQVEQELVLLVDFNGG